MQRQLDRWLHGCVNGWVISPRQQSQISWPYQLFLQTIPIQPTPITQRPGIAGFEHFLLGAEVRKKIPGSQLCSGGAGPPPHHSFPSQAAQASFCYQIVYGIMMAPVNAQGECSLCCTGCYSNPRGTDLLLPAGQALRGHILAASQLPQGTEQEEFILLEQPCGMFQESRAFVSQSSDSLPVILLVCVASTREPMWLRGDGGVPPC